MNFPSPGPHFVYIPDEASGEATDLGYHTALANWQAEVSQIAPAALWPGMARIPVWVRNEEGAVRCYTQRTANALPRVFSGDSQERLRDFADCLDMALGSSVASNATAQMLTLHTDGFPAHDIKTRIYATTPADVVDALFAAANCRA